MSMQVTVENSDNAAMCTSDGDPHYTTFDGFYYDNYQIGEFVYWRHKTLPFAVCIIIPRHLYQTTDLKCEIINIYWLFELYVSM